MSGGFRGSDRARRQAQWGGPSNPAEWAGLTPLRDWDMASAVVTTGSDIDSVPNAAGLAVAPLTGAATHKPQRVATSASFNNKQVAEFLTGLNVPYFTFGDLGASVDAALSIVMVAYSTNAGTYRYLLAASNDHLYVNSTPNWRTIANNTAIDTAVSSNAAAIIMQTISGGPGTQRLYISALTEKGNSVTTTLTYSVGGAIGNHYVTASDAYSMNGQIARILVFNKELTATERSAVFSALSTKYGIAVGA